MTLPILLALFVGNLQASIPTESEFLNSSSTPVVEAFTGEVVGEFELGLTSFGIYWSNEQAVASVWRIQNASDNAKIVDLFADNANWGGSFVVPARTQIYVASPDTSSSHSLIYDGFSLVSQVMKSELIYSLPTENSTFENGHALLTLDLSNGGHGGANVGQTWVRRELNSEEYDTGNFVTIENGQFILPAGTYLIEANQIFFSHIGIQKTFKGRIKNVSDGSTLAVGLNARIHIARGESAAVDAAIPKTVFSIDEESTFELQYFAQSAQTDSYGLGFAASSGEVERYAYVYISKLH